MAFDLAGERIVLFGGVAAEMFSVECGGSMPGCGAMWEMRRSLQ